MGRAIPPLLFACAAGLLVVVVAAAAEGYGGGKALMRVCLCMCGSIGEGGEEEGARLPLSLSACPNEQALPSGGGGEGGRESE